MSETITITVDPVPDTRVTVDASPITITAVTTASNQITVESIPDVKVTAAPEAVTITAFQGVLPGAEAPFTNLQTAINNAIANRERLVLPGGVIAIEETVTTPNKSGLVVEGCGTMYEQLNSSLRGAFTQIMWDSDDTTTPMIEFHGIHQDWSNVCLAGDDKNGSHGGKPTAGFHVVDDPGMGPGRHTWRKGAVEGCVAAFQAGTALSDSNCDNCIVDDIRVRNCDKLFYSKNQQCQGWRIDDCVFDITDSTDPVCFHFEAGGNFTSRKLTVIEKETQDLIIPDVLRLDQIHNAILGQNIRMFRFYDVKTDALASGACLLNCIETPYSDRIDCDVHFFGGTFCDRESYEELEKFAAILRGGVKLYFWGTNFEIDIKQAFKFTGALDPIFDGPHVLAFIGCTLRGIVDAQQVLYDGSDGEVYLIVRDCFNQLNGHLTLHDAIVAA